MSGFPQSEPPPTADTLVGRRPFWDSPWLWGLLFSSVSLVALELVSLKYGARQAQLERQHQGREWARLEGQGAQSPEFVFSTAEQTEIGLAPLRGLALLGLLASTGGLIYSRQRHRAEGRVAAAGLPASGEVGP